MAGRVLLIKAPSPHPFRKTFQKKLEFARSQRDEGEKFVGANIVRPLFVCTPSQRDRGDDLTRLASQATLPHRGGTRIAPTSMGQRTTPRSGGSPCIYHPIPF